MLGALCSSLVCAQSSPGPPLVELTPPTARLDPQRYELAGFPIVAGNTDIGVQFGIALTLTRFDGDIAPYLWNADLLLSASLKDAQGGLSFVQQSHVLRLDLPHLLDGRLRLDTRASFERTVNEGYFARGDNASRASPPTSASDRRFYQYLFEETRMRSIGRVHTGTPWDVAFAMAIRYVMPRVYANSRLAQDVNASGRAGGLAVIGTRATGLFKLGVGAMYDTRDSEFVTRSGLFYQWGVSWSLGTSSESIGYGELAAVLAHYVPLTNVFTVAARVVTSFMVGRAPFYDLAQGGVFEPQRLFGGETGIRGVPFGRYAGDVKALANLELRGLGWHFELIGQRLRVGTTTFVDVGRLWSAYHYDPARDGVALGLKYGVGGGLFMQWVEAAIFRIEAAYSPDAKSENPTLPIGIYNSDGLMF